MALPGVVPLSAATLPLLARPYPLELMECQRYFGKYILRAGIARDSSNNSNYFGASIMLTPMRTGPSISFADLGGNVSKATVNNNNGITPQIGGVGSAGQDAVCADIYFSANYYGWAAVAVTANSRM